MALLIKLLGESRLSVELWPIICSTVAAWLLVKIADLTLGRRIALLAGLLFVATPAFSLQLLTPSVESIEVALILAAILCLHSWQSQQARIWMFASGLFFGLAFQVRETSIVAAGLAATSMWINGMKPRLRDILAVGAGFLLPLAFEFLIYHQLTGDSLYRRHLSLAHTRIQSSELSSSIDTSRSPILNPEIIAGWRREPGFHVHWLVDGPLNLALNAKSGFSLLLTPLLLITARKQLTRRTCLTAWWLLILATAYIVVITYVLAMDPKPRVMLTALAASTLAFALVLNDLWRHNRKLLSATCLCAALIAGATIVAGYIRPAWADQQAHVWMKEFPDAIETDRMTKSMLTLNPDVRRMPDFGADRPLAMVVSISNCQRWIKQGSLSRDLTVEGERRLSLLPDITGSGAWICLFRYQRPIAEGRMDAAVNRAWERSD
jgi:4-amino-4-deoxy-L-arabinose transferase-like glycosyltransferase